MNVPDLTEDVDDQPQLKTCPLCGGKVIMSKYIEHYTIRCPNCELILHAQQYGQEGVEDLVARWNNRIGNEV